LLPIVEYCLKLNEEPSSKQFKRLNVLALLADDRIDMDDEHLNICLTLTLLPNLTKSRTEAADDSLHNCLIDMLDPTVNESKTENVIPAFNESTLPYSDTFEPAFVIPLILTVEPHAK
jgi:hypothetical protein